MLKSQPKARPFIQSFKNHFQLSYGSSRIPQRPDAEQTWNFIMSPASRPPADWRTETQLAAHTICAIGKDKTTLWADGSFASQAMVQAFRWTRLDFKCIVPRFKNDMNLHSFAQAVLQLETLEIPYEVMDMDLAQMLKNPSSTEWAKKYATDRASQLLAMHAWGDLQKRGLYMVFPFGFNLLERDQDGWKVVEHEKEYAVHQFQNDMKFDGVACFFKWSPEMVFAYLNDPSIRAIATNSRPTTSIDDMHLKQILENHYEIVGTRNWSGLEKSTFEIKKFHQILRADPNFKLHAYAFNYVDYIGRLQFKMPANAQMEAV